MKRTRTISLYEYQQKLFFALAGILVVTAMMYAYFLNKTIHDIVFVDENQKQMAEMRSGLSTLENEYLAKDKEMNLEKAHELGFINAGSSSYLSRGTLGSALSLNNASQ
ncbi:MAG: hypothetical protein Q7S34_03820 [bacterium]|nr:hypothetical protein [bacterium]